MKWIRVEDELPVITNKSKRWISVLIYGIPTCGGCSPRWSVREARFVMDEENEFFEFGEYDCSIDVTHWMELPLPPDEE